MSQVRNPTGPRHFELPPKPMTLDAAYRRVHGLVTPALQWNTRKGTYDHYVQALAVMNPKITEVHGDSFTDAGRSVRLITRSEKGKFLAGRVAEQALWVRMSKLVMFDVMPTLIQEQENNWVERWLAWDRMSPNLRIQWFERYQEATWSQVTQAFERGDIAAACTELRILADAISTHSYLSEHTHFGALLPVLEDVMQALSARGMGHQWQVPWTGSIDDIALRLNPWQAQHQMHATPMIQALDAYVPFANAGANATRALGAWDRDGTAFSRGPSDTPRITMTASSALQAVERMVEMGTRALRDVGDNEVAAADVARDLWTLLGRDDVYPHIAYFNSTRLAMGILHEALGWDGKSTPTLTPAVAGYGKLFRSTASTLAQSRVLAYPDARTQQAMYYRNVLDPLKHMHEPRGDTWLRQEAPWYLRVLDYLDACTRQRLFDGDYVEAMQHSVTIHAPNHAAAAIVVHDDGGEP